MNTFAAVALYVLVTLVIPVFQDEEAHAGEASAWRLVGAILTWVGLALILLTAIAAIWPGAIAWCFRLNPKSANLTADLIRVMSPALALQGITAVLTALLQVRGRFARPAAIGVAFNAGILVGIVVLHNRLGIRAAAWGVVLGAVLQIALQLPQFVRFWRTGGGRLAVTHPRLIGTGVLALPVLAGSVSQQINSLTDKIFASTVGNGKNAALNFANALGSAPRTALLFPLLIPLFPHIARLMNEGRHLEMTAAFRRAAGLLAMVAMPLSAFMAIEAHGLTQVAFERKRCQHQCRVDIASAVHWYGLAIWAAFMVYLLNRALSAARAPKDIMVATLTTVVVVIGLDLALLGPMGIAGLALATLIGSVVNAGIMLWQLRRRLPGFGARAVLIQQGRIAIATVPAAVVLVALSDVVSSVGHHWTVGALILAGKGLLAAAVFLAATRVIAPAELRSSTDALRSVVRRRRPAEG